MIPEQAERFAKDLLDGASGNLAYAENKASILLAGVLAALGGIAAAISSIHWPVIHQPPYIAVPFWAATAAALAAIVGLGAAIYPRTMPHAPDRLTSVAFFGDVAALESPVRLRGLLTAPDMSILDIWVDQVWQISLIASRKYCLVRWSIRLLGSALALGIVTGIAVMAHAG